MPVAALNYAENYGRTLEQAFPYVLYFGRLYATPSNGRYRIGDNGKTCYFPHISTGGRVDADNDTISTAARDYENSWEPKTLRNHRKWKTTVHPRDVDLTNMATTIENITTEFNNSQKFPEMDAYCVSRIYADWRELLFAPTIATLTTTNVLDMFDELMQRMDEKRVPATGRVLYLTPKISRMLKNASGVSRSFNTQGGGSNIDRIITALDNVEIVVVPPELMKTAYSFNKGWAPAAAAKQIDMLLIHPLTVITPVNYEFSKLDEPGANTDGMYIYFERSDEDVFVLNYKANGIQFIMADAGDAGALNVASAAGTETAGDTKITVTGGNANGTTLAYKIAAAAIDAPKLGVEPTDYTEFENEDVISGQTASHYIRVVELNADGKVLATGQAQLTVKA